jgi:Zn-dependent alcohol dehydrogenase
LIIEEIFVAPPMPHEARIRIICTSLCHSDVIFWNMQVFIFFTMFLLLFDLINICFCLI